MKHRLKTTAENTADKLTHRQKLTRRKIVPARKKIRQLLRSLLPMEQEQRQYQEENNFYHNR